MSINISTQYDGIFSPPIVDNSLDEYKYTEYQCDEAVTSTQNNYKITIRDVDSWVALHQGFLKVKCHVTNPGGDFPDSITEDCALENNAVNFFERTELRLGDQKVDQLEYAGLTSLIKGLSDISGDWKDSNGETMLWVPDDNDEIDYEEFVTTADEGFTSRNADFNAGYARRRDITLNATANTKKINTFMIPLRKLFPLLNNFRHPVKGIRSSISLWKNNDVNVISRLGTAGGSNDMKFIIDDMSVFVPVLVPTLEKGVELDTKFASGMTIPIDWNRCETIVSTPFTANSSAQNYRLATLSERPVRIWVGLQTVNRLNHTDQRTISQVFDNLDLEYLHAKINSSQYPEEQYNPNWEDDDYVREYLDFTKGANFDLTTGSSVPFKQYSTTYPVYCIDCSAMPESVFSRGSNADIVLKFKLRSTPSSAYHLVAVIESEAHLDLQPISSDRVKISN